MKKILILLSLVLFSTAVMALDQTTAIMKPIHYEQDGSDFNSIQWNWQYFKHDGGTYQVHVEKAYTFAGLYAVAYDENNTAIFNLYFTGSVRNYFGYKDFIIEPSYLNINGIDLTDEIIYVSYDREDTNDWVFYTTNPEYEYVKVKFNKEA